MLCMLPVAFTPARVFLSLVTKSPFPLSSSRFWFCPLFVRTCARSHPGISNPVKRLFKFTDSWQDRSDPRREEPKNVSNWSLLCLLSLWFRRLTKTLQTRPQVYRLGSYLAGEVFCITYAYRICAHNSLAYRVLYSCTLFAITFSAYVAV